LVSQRWGPASIEDAAARWARSVRAAREAAPGLARYCEVRYEDLLGYPDAGARGVFQFLGLEASDTVLDAVLRESGVAYNTDRRLPEVGTGKWRAEWTAQDVAAFERVAGDLRAELGYPAAGAPRRPVRRGSRRLKVRLSRSYPPAPSERPWLALEARQRRVDEVCGALALADVTLAAACLADNAAVRIVGCGKDEQARGDAGRALLARASAAGTSWGTQRRGDVYVAGTMWTVVLTHDGVDGPVDRVVVVQFDEGDSITGLTVYAFPL
jgi:hypothetical protein